MLIETESVGMSFEGVATEERFVALDGVDLRIEPGEFITLVGPSGCGKSTLLSILGGLLEPTSGQVTYRGEVLTEPQREIGIMFQTPVLLPWRTVEQNAMLPAEIYDVPKDSILPAIQDVVTMVGLNGFSKAYPHQLSGGMKQRAALARVLAYDPEVMLMDEPFGALDEFTREAMNLLLTDLIHKNEVTVVFVTHSITEAVFLADRVAVMQTRPGHIAGIIDVPFDQPRSTDIMRKSEFTDLVFEVRQLLGGGIL